MKYLKLYEDERGKFFTWLFSNRKFWVLSIIYAGYVGLEELRLKMFTSFIRIFVGSLLIMGVIFLIFYSFESSIIKKFNKKLMTINEEISRE